MKCKKEAPTPRNQEGTANVEAFLVTKRHLSGYLNYGALVLERPNRSPCVCLSAILAEPLYYDILGVGCQGSDKDTILFGIASSHHS